MGGSSSSESTITKVTDIAYNAINHNMQSCVGSASQNQLIKLNNIHGNIDLRGVQQSQGVSVDMKCAFSTEVQNKIQDQIASDINNLVTSKGGDFTAGSSSSATNTNITNILKTTIDNKSVSEQVTQTMQSQTVSITDVGGNVIASGLTQEQ